MAAHETCKYPDYFLRVKKNVKYDKNQINLHFFLWKIGVEASKVITNTKKIDFVTSIPFDTFPCHP